MVYLLHTYIIHIASHAGYWLFVIEELGWFHLQNVEKRGTKTNVHKY